MTHPQLVPPDRLTRDERMRLTSDAGNLVRWCPQCGKVNKRNLWLSMNTLHKRPHAGYPPVCAKCAEGLLT